eukprot:COSAG02_NODE_135_length_34565_cov_80.368856_13_plen_90_part_00
MKRTDPSMLDNALDDSTTTAELETQRTAIAATTDATANKHPFTYSLYERIVSVDLRIYRAFFPTTEGTDATQIQDIDRERRFDVLITGM